MQFQDNLLFLIKTQKRTTLQQVPDEETLNLVLKRMLEIFLKVPSLKKILEFQNQEKDYETCTKRKFQSNNQAND